MHRTAIQRGSLSAPARWLLNHGKLKGRILDYGCGRGDILPYYSPLVIEYDPHYTKELPHGKFDTIYCGYVANIILSKSERDKMLAHASSYLAPGGNLYVAVRRDIPRKGTATQAWVELTWPILTENSRYAIYRKQPGD